MKPLWDEGLPASITVCDAEGVILWMNKRAIESFKEEGGEALIGKNLSECHPEHANVIIGDMLRNKSRNVYTIEKDGKKKLIYQSPWYREENFAGLVELSLEIPAELPHFIRS